MMVNNNLVGGIPTPLKNMNVSWDDYNNPDDHNYLTMIILIS